MKIRKKDEFKVTGIIVIHVKQDFITIGSDKVIVEILIRLVTP